MRRRDLMAMFGSDCPMTTAELPRLNGRRAPARSAVGTRRILLRRNPVARLDAPAGASSR
jgi:hypothetical protein